VHWLDVSRQHLATGGIGRAKTLVGMSGVTHSAIGAISFGDSSWGSRGSCDDGGESGACECVGCRG
jgi:hypothetical protein